MATPDPSAVDGNRPLDGGSEPKRRRRLRHARFLRLVGAFLKNAWISGGAITAFIAAVMFIFINPFRAAPPVPTDDDVATAWSRAISRLGISPLYPPQEDFAVGDILAVLDPRSASGNNNGEAGTQPKKPDPAVPFLNHSVRIGHVDLHEYLANDAPIFAETDEKGGGQAAKDGPDIEKDVSAKKKIILRLVAFPGIQVHRDRRDEGNLISRLFSGGSSRSYDLTDSIGIPLAQSYSADAPSAAGALLKWCSEHKGFCSDEGICRMLGLGLGDGGLIANHPNVEIEIVTRVYMTRAIDQSTSVSGGSSASVEQGGSALPDAKGPEDAAEAPTKRGPGNSRVGFSASDRTIIAFGHAAFSRPLVFGFRAATITSFPKGVCP